jgi:hypothetical protein
MASDDAVWERLLTMMPLCPCGQRLQPGGTPGLSHALVCTSCSYVAMVSEGSVADMVALARRAVEREEANDD